MPVIIAVVILVVIGALYLVFSPEAVSESTKIHNKTKNL